MNMKISTMFKGFFVGATMLVPGVSGGSMAMILGEYERLISSVSSFRKDVKGNAFYLMQFAYSGSLPWDYPAGILLFWAWCFCLIHC